MAAEVNGKSPTAQRMLKFAFNLVDDGLMGQQVFAGEATRLAYMTDEAVEGRDAFLEKRDPGLVAVPLVLLRPLTVRLPAHADRGGVRRVPRPVGADCTPTSWPGPRGCSREEREEARPPRFPATVADVAGRGGRLDLRASWPTTSRVGLAVARAAASTDSLFVYDIEIDEPHRGRGLGRATMLAAEDVARGRAADRFIAPQRLRLEHQRRRRSTARSATGPDSIQMSKPLEEPP